MIRSLTEGLSAYRDKTILVSGATGYLGSALVQALSGISCRLVLLVRQTTGLLQPLSSHADHIVVQDDVSQRSAWERTLPGVDYVFHLAAHEHKRGSQHDPTVDLAVNALSVLHMLEVCRESRLFPGIVFASSSNLVGSTIRLPVDETFPDNPLTIYAIHKLMAEKYLGYYTREFELRTVALRLANVYGPVSDQSIGARVVLNRLVREAVRGGPLTLFENQSCIRDFVYIDDAVTAFLLAGASLAAVSGQHFVIGSGAGYRIADAVKLIADRAAMRTGHRPSVEVDTTARIEPVEWRSFVADSSRFRAITGWSPRVPLVDGIDRTLDFFLDEAQR